jgi:hypothetical protein
MSYIKLPYFCIVIFYESSEQLCLTWMVLPFLLRAENLVTLHLQDHIKALLVDVSPFRTSHAAVFEHTVSARFLFPKALNRRGAAKGQQNT